ncbi:cyclin-J-like [Zerene cesonia]|uniref:cyclin-J-like n=1 Tax=Zerene cesonia TaxID=33412 RepID=UPI0018E57A80|nr:cyclin-J-like [Zerene cesonia]XP_038221271.1 cyclin-J-like [Zerene cesonia]
MESLNMSKLNLSSVRSHATSDNCPKPDVSEVKYESNTLLDPDDEFHCEYRDDIWKNLLEQDAQKPVIHLQSPQLEFRGALVQQLRDVSKKLGLSLATLHSAVAQLDLFMDAHRLRADRLTHVALACLSLAAKSEEKLSRAPTLKTLAKISGVQLCGKTFRQLEWMVGQHVRWRLLAPTPVTFAALLAQYVVTDADLTTRHPKFVRRFRRDGAKLLEAYLDLTLSDVRLKVVESVEVGCACVSCARAELGLCAWPRWLADLTGRRNDTVAPVARLLHRMMQIKSRDTTECEVDQGYSSARTTPNITPSTSPQYQTSPPTTCTNYLDYRQPINTEYLIPETNLNYYRISQQTDHRLCRASRLIEASIEPSTSMAVKRNIDSNELELDRKRYRVSLSQAVQ